MYIFILKTKSLHVAVTRIPVCMMVILIAFFIIHMGITPIFGVMENYVFDEASTVTLVFFIVCTCILVIEVCFGVICPCIPTLRVVFLSKFAVVLMVTFGIFVFFSVIYMSGMVLNSWKNPHTISFSNSTSGGYHENFFVYNYIHNLCVDPSGSIPSTFPSTTPSPTPSPSPTSSPSHPRAIPPLTVLSSPLSLSSFREAFASVFSLFANEYISPNKTSSSFSSVFSSPFFLHFSVTSSTSSPSFTSYTPTPAHTPTIMPPLALTFPPTHTHLHTSPPAHVQASLRLPNGDVCEDDLDFKLQEKLVKRFFQRNVFLGALFFGFYVVFTILIVGFSAAHFRWYKSLERKIQLREQRKRDRELGVDRTVRDPARMQRRQQRRAERRAAAATSRTGGYAARFSNFLQTGKMNENNDDDDSSVSDSDSDDDDDFFDTKSMAVNERQKQVEKSASSVDLSASLALQQSASESALSLFTLQIPPASLTPMFVPPPSISPASTHPTSLAEAFGHGAVKVGTDEEEDTDEYEYMDIQIDDYAQAEAQADRTRPSPSGK